MDEYINLLAYEIIEAWDKLEGRLPYFDEFIKEYDEQKTIDRG